jgi:MOSC domain-containing protein YiiM
MHAADTPLPAPTTLLEVRIGKVRRLGETDIMTAIAKSVCAGPVAIEAQRVRGDEQGEAIIHGGPDKSVLQYARHHYAQWQAEFPESAPLFAPGGFGENLVAESWDETTMCIGDVVEIGGALLQVAQPRSPCFKLNHRFGQQTMSRRAQQTHRTGWYYRVLQQGVVQAGDTMQVVERPLPQWTVDRVQHYLYDEPRNQDAAHELSTMPLLAEALRTVFGRRCKTRTVEEWNARLIDAGTAAIASGVAAVPAVQ